MALVDLREHAHPVAIVGRRSQFGHLLVVSAATAAGVSLALLGGREGSPLWQVARVVAIGALTIPTAITIQRGDRRRAGAIARVFGIAALTVGAGFMPFLVKTGISVTSTAAVTSSVAGIILILGGSLASSRGKRTFLRVATALATFIAAAVVGWVATPAFMATNVPRPEIGATPASRGLRYESTVVTTRDGVHLAAWYIPSRNRAAVVLLHGAGSTRSDVLDEAVVLARHRFGVLLVDARGHGGSSGRAMDFGWYGDRDIEAATRFLSGRSEVDRTRIGVVGMSMGGEEAIGASATNDLIRAVVAEGATARSAGDEAWLSEQYGWRGAVQEQFERAQDAVTALLTTASAPTSNRAAVEASKTEYLIIAGGDVPDEVNAAAYVAAGAPDRVRTWTVPGSGHIGGLQTAPQEWERRVIAFLTDELNVADAIPMGVSSARDS